MVKLVVGIDGIDGSGKSTLARRLVEQCHVDGVGAALFAIDDFRRRVDWRHAIQSESDIYYSDYYDFAAVETCLGAFTRGADHLAVPVYDDATERTTGSRILSLAGIDVAFVEGVFALRAPAVGRGLLIYLQSSAEAARERIVARDTAKGRSVAEVQHRIDTRYFPAQARYHREFAPFERADIVIDNEQLGSAQVRVVNEHGVPAWLSRVLASVLKK